MKAAEGQMPGNAGFSECRFPASMLASLLPHLATTPGLISLKFWDLTGGFNDSHVEDLLRVLNNPYLLDVQIQKKGGD